jgi:hypothetical protein
MTPDEQMRRELLWLRHGCQPEALYGDDGEMQCTACLIDFLREAPGVIAKRFRILGERELLRPALAG